MSELKGRIDVGEIKGLLKIWIYFSHTTQKQLFGLEWGWAVKTGSFQQAAAGGIAANCALVTGYFWLCKNQPTNQLLSHGSCGLESGWRVFRRWGSQMIKEVDERGTSFKSLLCRGALAVWKHASRCLSAWAEQSGYFAGVLPLGGCVSGTPSWGDYRQ